MKLFLAAFGLLIACGSLEAQVASEANKEQKTGKKADTVRPAEPGQRRHSGYRPQQERPAQERETSEGTVKLDRARPTESQRPSSPPSPAQQSQQQQYEQRQQQQSQQRPQQQNPPSTSNASRVVQCNARPVCGGGYGRCAAVAQTYQGGTLQSGRRAIVQNCIAANTPDSCNCAAQCTSVARCSIF